MTRVSLREIKDFAVPLNVNVNVKKELFWKWHLIPNKEAEIFLREILNPQPKQEIPKPEPSEVKEKEQKEEVVKPQEMEIKKQEPRQDTLVKPKPKKQEPKEDFFKKVKSHFSRKNIEIIKELAEKRAEGEYILKIPSQIGDVEFYCRVKNKKRISDSDLNLAFAQGQLLKLPIVLITSGELSKKAEEKLKEYKSMIIKKI